MARKTYVFQTNEDGTYKRPLEMVEKHLRVAPPIGKMRRDKRYHNIIEDIQPYRSTIDGSMIGSRSKHRAHLREHGCEEIGTENFDRAQTHFQKPEQDTQREVAQDMIKAYEQSH